MTPLLMLSLALAAPEKSYVIRGATVYDGSGQRGVVQDVAIAGSKITGLGKVEVPAGATVIDGTGLIVAPGFIDLHTHCDGSITTDKTHRQNACYVLQGVTTVITGNCGSGPVDAGKFFQTLESGGIGTNVIHQVPHNDVRKQVMGNVNRPPTADELAKMSGLVDKAMTDGAWNLSTGLIYNPGTYSKTDELIALAKISAKHGGHYASHIRDESAQLLDAIAEAIKVGREAGCPVHISHIKCSGAAFHGHSVRAVAMIEKARKEGMIVTADQYPYIASSTSLRAQIVPTRWREGTDKEIVARLDDPNTGPKIRAEIAVDLKDGKHIQVARYAKKPEWNGQRISDIAAKEQKEPIDIVMEIERNGSAQIVNFGMSEEDVRVYMKQPWVATASDGGTQVPGPSVPHPRSYGTFPRKIGRYSIEDNAIPLAQAIRSASGLPADILKLPSRGYLKPDYFADVVVFDPKTFRDVATYDKPHQYSTGVKWLFVNGQPVIEDGKHKPEVLAGQVLRHVSALKK
jgi:N-acyl-D-aspartate/D-glutamate deacylase